MADFNKNRFQSKTQTWETPQDLFDRLNDEFHFTCDVCASAANAKCSNYYSEENSCLTKDWSGVNWMNPPYKDMKRFIKKAFEQRHNAVTVCLIPARTNTKWWHEWCMKGEVMFICGRPKFRNSADDVPLHGLPQPLALVVFGRGSGVMSSFYI